MSGQVHPNDRKRIARLTELVRSGIDPAPDHDGGGELWTASFRHPTLLVGLLEEDEPLVGKIRARVEAMARAGAADEAERAREAGAARTVQAAIGFDEFREGDLDRIVTLHRRYGRRQMTWMRRMDGVNVVNRTGLTDAAVAREILALADDH